MRRRGVTLIEILVALLLLGTALAGLAGLWTFSFNITRHSQDLRIGYNVARQEIERAKNIGFSLLPEGTWTTAYDGLGNPTTDGSGRFIATATVQTIPDANGRVHTGCLRLFRVQVTERGTRRTTFDSTTYLSRGGI